MKTQIEKVDESTVRLRVEVEPAEFEPEIEKAVRDLSGRVRLKGFRKGKVPRQILESHVGRGAITEAAVDSSLERFLVEATEAEELEVVGSPRIDNVDVSTGGLAFEATLVVMPKIELPEWEGLEIEIPPLEVADEDVDKEIDTFRERLAPLEEVGRPAADGDFVLVDIKGQIHGETLPGLSLSDFSYRVGSGTVVPKLDEELAGKRPGDILKFNDRVVSGPPGANAGAEGSVEAREATFTVIVKEVRERRPEPLTDAWVEDNTEFDTVEELRSDVTKKIALAKKLAARSTARHRAVEKLADLVDAPIPEEAIGAEAADLARRLEARLRQAGASLDDYFRSADKPRGEIEYEWRKQALMNLKSDLCLSAIARAEGIEASEEEIERDASMIASGAGDDAERLREELTKGRSARSLAAGIIKSKALDRVLEKAVLTQEGGAAVSWGDLAIPEAAASEAQKEAPETGAFDEESESAEF